MQSALTRFILVQPQVPLPEVRPKYGNTLVKPHYPYDEGERPLTAWTDTQLFKENGMQNNKRVGTQTQLQCIAYLHNLGCDIIEPIGDNSRYDFILDIDGELFRVQSKTASPSNGSWNIRCVSVYTNSKRTKVVRYEKGSVDLFCTFILGRCYIIRFDELGKRVNMALRINKTKNSQRKKVNNAEDYTAEKFITSEIKEHGSMAQLVSAVGS